MLIGLYLRPGVGFSTSPVVLLDRDSMEVRVVASSFTRVRSALVLVAAQWLDDWRRVLDASERFGSDVSYLRPVSPEFAAEVRRTEPESLELWRANIREDSKRLWRHADLEHPFAHLDQVPFDDDPTDAAQQIDAFVREHPRTPELVAMQLCTYARAGRALRADAVRTVLAAEAWRERKVLMVGYWRVMGKGLGEWDATLKAAADLNGALTGPFERLRSHPRLYSGEDDEAVDVLVEVGREFERAGDWETALNQYRNAAAVAGLSGAYLGRVTRQEVHDAIANACDQIEPGCLAAEVARVSARAIAVGL